MPVLETGPHFPPRQPHGNLFAPLYSPKWLWPISAGEASNQLLPTRGGGPPLPHPATIATTIVGAALAYHLPWPYHRPQLYTSSVVDVSHAFCLQLISSISNIFLQVREIACKLVFSWSTAIWGKHMIFYVHCVFKQSCLPCFYSCSEYHAFILKTIFMSAFYLLQPSFPLSPLLSSPVPNLFPFFWFFVCVSAFPPQHHSRIYIPLVGKKISTLHDPVCFNFRLHNPFSKRPHCHF